ncbi:MAG: cobalt-precorrin-4/precorrin-4 C(11)-methyltransferase [Acidimicrobiales bacterium]
MISFVGAGPGAADLVTLRGAQRLAGADLVVWASSLVPEALLEHCRPGAAVFDSATMTLEDVLALYGGQPEGAPIVRLHSGDPSLYGAVAEQAAWCDANARSWEIVPGVTSLAALAAAAGTPLTVPGVSQSVVLTRLPGKTAASMPGGGVAALAGHGSTMAIFLAGARPDELQAELLSPGSGYGPDTPALIGTRVSWPDEALLATTVGRVAQDMRSTGSTMTMLVVVGEAMSAGPPPRRSHLYSPGFTTAYRLRSVEGSTRGRPSARRR